MSSQTQPVRFESVEDYIAWTRTRAEPGRTELDNGDVLDMAPETLSHVRTKNRVQAALSRAIREAGLECEAVGDGVGVQTSDRSLFIPDALVYCGAPPPDQALIVGNPSIVVEVVSPSSGTRDLAEKMPAYFQAPSIMHYLLVHPTSRFIVHFRRAEVNAPSARIFYDGEILLEPPGFIVAFEDILPKG